METASDLMHMADKDGSITYVNEAMARTLGYSKEGMIGMHVTQVLREETLEKEYKKVSKELIAKGKISLETIWIKKDGGKIHGEAKVVAIYDCDGGFAGTRGVFRDISFRKKAEQVLLERDAELKNKARNLEEMNTALQVLLKRREDDKAELEERVLFNMRELIMPYIEKLKRSERGRRNNAYLSILEANLDDIISPFSHGLSTRHMKLTPAEIQISNFIKQGKTTQEIAELLNLSSRTVESHRKNIRKKFGIQNKKENLRTHLLHLH